MTAAARRTDVKPLRVVDVSKRFGRRWVLRDCSFDLRPGRVTALIGPNGAGKSTLMAAAAGLLTTSAGRIEVGGQIVTASPSHPDLGYLAQDKPLYPSLPGERHARDRAAPERAVGQRARPASGGGGRA